KLTFMQSLFSTPLQVKKFGSPLSASVLINEHKKSMDITGKIREDSQFDQQGIKHARIIIVLVTTADITGHERQQLVRSFPDNCLLIHRGNFTSFFGYTFSLSAALDISRRFNRNFVTCETLQKKHGLGD